MIAWWKIAGPLVALVLAYGAGRMDGSRIEQGAQLRADRAADKERVKWQGEIEASAVAAEAQEHNRQSDVREIYRETQKIIERPVYSTICLDADGVRLLDVATDNANGKRLPAPVDAAPATASAPQG